MDAHAEICRAIDQYKEHAVSISHQIHEKPEPKFQEHFVAAMGIPHTTEPYARLRQAVPLPGPKAPAARSGARGRRRAGTQR